MRTNLLKPALVLLTFTFYLLPAFAQSPEKMSYQAVIRNASGQLVVNSQIGMRVSILQGSVSGTEVFKEICNPNPMTNANGLVSVEIGSGIVVSGDFTTIDWANGPYFIKTETDPAGSTSYSITGTSQLLSVPYAFHAKTAESLVGGGGSAHYIGEQFGGGVIFHLWKDSAGVEHGLIVDLNDLGTNHAWSNVDNSIIGAPAQSIWDGLNNSNAIVAQAGHTTSAAALCLNSTNGGQSDWYLPSIDELRLLWHNRFNLNLTLSTIGGACILPIVIPSNYWSSTEHTSGFVWYQSFSSGSQNASNKNSTYKVRAVRAF